MATEPAARSSCARRRKSSGGTDLVRILLLSVLLLPGIMLARTGPQQGSSPAGGTRPAAPPLGTEAKPQARGTGQQQPPRPGAIFRRLRELPPAQQQRFMANDPQFQRLSSELQESVRERLRQWNTLTPQQKEAIREREEIFAGLSPAQRQAARTVFFQYRDLTQPRRQAVTVAFRHLRDLPPEQRRSYLDSQEVREQFSPHEREILEGLNKLLPNSGPAAPGDPDQ